MNGEEKILAMLEKMDGRLEKLEAGQAKLEDDMAFVKGVTVRMEQEHGKKLSALFDAKGLSDRVHIRHFHKWCRQQLVTYGQALPPQSSDLEIFFGQMVDNVIPYIGGDEEGKSEQEPKKIWGTLKDGIIVPDYTIDITAQCIRVPVSDGHLAAMFVSFDKQVSKDEILELWNEYKGRPQELNLPSAPKQFLHYFDEIDRPQTKLDRMLENGMAITLGRLREDSQFDYKFIALSHNTLRGAAGGAVLLAELLCAENYI